MTGETPDAEMPDARMSDTGVPETVEVRRFADSLAVLEAGERLDIDPSEDPELSRLVATSVALADAFTAATETPRFESYRMRSRAAILGRLQPSTAVEPVHLWQRRWINIFAPVASAAAAAALTLAFVIATDDPSPVAPTTAVSNLPDEGTASDVPADLQTISASLVERIEKIGAALEEMERRTNNGELVSADFLRALTEQHATVAADIARAEPGSLPDGIATSAFRTTIISSTILENAKTDPDATGALEAARQQSQLARQVAGDYLVATQFSITRAQDEAPVPEEIGEMPITEIGEPF